jgi:hypothetical protein
MYGCELWGYASKTTIHIFQTFQSKILREIAYAPWFVSNHTLHTDFQIPLVQDVIQGRKRHHRSRIEVLTNPLMGPLLQVHNNRRLVRVWPTDVAQFGVGAMLALDAERERVVDVITLVAVIPLSEPVRISSRCNALSRNC